MLNISLTGISAKEEPITINAAGVVISPNILQVSPIIAGAFNPVNARKIATIDAIKHGVRNVFHETALFTAAPSSPRINAALF